MISNGHIPQPKSRNHTWSGNPLTWKDSESRGWNVTLEWATVNGAPQPTGISIALARGEGTLNSSVLRELPIGALARYDLQHGAARVSSSRPNPQPAPKDRGPQRGQSLDPKILDQVARLYQQAVTTGVPPAMLIAHQFAISQSAAAKRIMAARKAGFLGPASPGKKGERPHA